MFEKFLKERTYLKNVSPRTIEWHTQSLRWLGTENPTAEDCKAAVLRMREAGLKVSSVNCRLRSINAYLKWLGSDLKVEKLKEPVRVLPVYTENDVHAVMRWKPKTFYERRLQALVLTLADTGARLDEVLSLQWNQVDFDNLLITVIGKGDKQRVIPFSFELRKILYAYQTRGLQEGRRDNQGTSILAASCKETVQTQNQRVIKRSHSHRGIGCAGTVSGYSSLIFRTRANRKLSRRNTLRDVKLLCQKLGIKIPPRSIHAWRHSYATNYIKRGGSILYLQRCLGHSNLSTTQIYCHVNTDDLSAAHAKISLLS